MEISLQPELAQFLTEQVERGLFPSVDVAVNEGVRLLLRQKLLYQERFEELQKEIMRGVADSERGDVIVGDVVFTQLRDRLNKHKQEG
ncbi:hypothetical protein VB712_14395 [Spirulina sp. CCNP1310]|uniref:ribbon-helix-helix domain-containing protein n=1 Tax=Spirulina sp. CCNP1310 TaxID=3110249 RepID=UPI002B200314|nr:hypothetical protein [Spirulina sp. CCNP1310]MEA5420418.1 hypothetical protein [Spirulina sp. CCNP1310]